MFSLFGLLLLSCVTAHRLPATEAVRFKEATQPFPQKLWLDLDLWFIMSEVEANAAPCPGYPDGDSNLVEMFQNARACLRDGPYSIARSWCRWREGGVYDGDVVLSSSWWLNNTAIALEGGSLASAAVACEALSGSLNELAEASDALPAAELSALPVPVRLGIAAGQMERGKPEVAYRLAKELEFQLFSSDSAQHRTQLRLDAPGKPKPDAFVVAQVLTCYLVAMSAIKVGDTGSYLDAVSNVIHNVYIRGNLGQGNDVTGFVPIPASAIKLIWHLGLDCRARVFDGEPGYLKGGCL